MATYTLVITNGSSPYTFDVTPELKRDFSFEHDESKSPAELTVITETWTLRGAVYRHATPATVTTDLATLVTLLSNKATPVNSVAFKRDGSTVYELTTSAQAVLMVKSLETEPGPGMWVNHWRGTLVVVGRTLKTGSGDTADIVRLEKRITDSYEDNGLRRRVLEGKVETAIGTSARTKAQAQAEDTLGSSFVFLTGGDDNIEVTVQNEPEDTIATFRQIQQERGVAIPSTATDYRISVETVLGDEKRTITTVGARGTSVANARTAVRTAKPTANLATSDEREDQDGLGFAATYTQIEPNPSRVASWKSPKITSLRRAVTVSGGGQPRIFDLVPGYRPYLTRGAHRPVVVRERIQVRAVNVVAGSDIPLPSYILPVVTLDGPECEDGIPERESKGEQDAADVWVRTATRVYKVADESEIDFAALFTAVRTGNGYASEPDFKTRSSK